ncbi:MAG: hypothetical protein LLG97_19415 [Deltaproteobacteria bacterium]|nr:hypothetical protein [Deltaproteobacteria bacterium]
MKAIRMMFVAVVALFCVSSAAAAADFDWMPDFNIQAAADASGFRARLATRFHIGDTTIDAVIGNVEKPADAYMVMRLGEMAKRPPEEVLREYKSSHGKGWGALAKSLGIKPGSKEFHALKRGQDLYDGSGMTKGKGKHKNKKKD